MIGKILILFCGINLNLKWADPINLIESNIFCDKLNKIFNILFNFLQRLLFLYLACIPWIFTYNNSQARLEI